MRKIRVLVVDDSAIVRKVLSETLAGEPDLEVVGTAPDPYVARDKIAALNPDVLTLDIEMPRMDGLTFLRKLMKHRPMPVVIVSSLAESSCKIALEALRIGAVGVLAKPGGPYSVGDLTAGIADAIRAAAAARPRSYPPPPDPPPVSADASEIDLVAIGASTGGTEAIRHILPQLSERCPPVVIAQHIPPVFSRAFARSLNESCRVEVKEAENGDYLVPGRAVVAPGNLHMIVRRSGGQYRVEVKDGPRVCYQRPSVDVLFHSVAAAGPRAVGVLLTGMGGDGAEGLLAMRQAGAWTLAQDEASSVVFGMPKVAIQLGAACQVLPLDRIAASILGRVAGQPLAPSVR